MSDAALKRVFVALGVLAVLYLGSRLIPGTGGSGGASSTGALSAWFEALDPDSIQRLEISSPTLDPSIRLERADGRWNVNGHPADSGSVARLLTELGGATVGDVMSTNPANHGRMGLSADSTTTLAVTAGTSVDTVFLGSTGPGFGSLFARLPSEDEVHLVNADLRSSATRALDAWRSKRLLALDTASVTTVEVLRDGDRFALTRGEAGWTVDGVATDSTRARPVLQELASFQATGFAEEETPSGNPDREIVAQDASGAVLASVRLWNRPEGGSDLLAVVDSPVAEAGTVYTVPAWRADRIAPTRETLQSDEDGGG